MNKSTLGSFPERLFPEGHFQNEHFPGTTQNDHFSGWLGGFAKQPIKEVFLEMSFGEMFFAEISGKYL